VGAGPILCRGRVCLQCFLQQGILPIYLALYPGNFEHRALVGEGIAGGEVLLGAIVQVRQPVAYGFWAVHQPIEHAWVQGVHGKH